MRVLFSSTSGHGHVLPMVPLAQAFLAAGHDVLWATATQATPLVTGSGIEAVAAGAGGAEEGALRGAVFREAAGVPGEARAAFVFPRMFGAALTPPMARDLAPLAEDWKPDLLVHEQAELAAPLVGALRGIPTVTHSFGTAVPLPILADTRERLAALWGAHGLEIPAYAGCYRSGYLDICPASVQCVPVDHIPVVRPLRPVAEAAVLPPPAEPLVYVTLGTVHNRSELLREVVTAVASLGVRVLVATGPGVEPASLGELPDDVQVESWVDQPAVLRQATAVVSHGGSGTFLGALARGLPQLCLPQAADQFRNAEGGTRAGAVVVLTPTEVTTESLSGAVARVLEDPQLRAGARSVAEEMARMPGPAEVVEQLTRIT